VECFSKAKALQPPIESEVLVQRCKSATRIYSHVVPVSSSCVCVKAHVFVYLRRHKLRSGKWLLYVVFIDLLHVGTIEIDLLEPDAFHWLIGRRQWNEYGVIYWNDYFAIVFEFSADDDKVIDMLVFSDRI